MSSFLADYERKREIAKEEAKQRLLSKIPELVKAGIERVDAYFSGEGDEGSVQSITYYGPEDREIEDGSAGTFGLKEDDFYPLLPPGFEINEGSSGHVIVNVLKKTVTLSTDWNQIVTENEMHEL